MIVKYVFSQAEIAEAMAAKAADAAQIWGKYGYKAAWRQDKTKEQSDQLSIEIAIEPEEKADGE